MKKISDGVLRTAGALALLAACARGQMGPQLGVPAIAAQAKGPNQINLTWPAVADPGYGYLVEVQSQADRRFSAWTELQPIPQAGGYTCDPTILVRGGRCNVSDPTGQHVYNPPNRGIAYWVTDATYVDPQDGSPAQFIAWGLKPNTTYTFRVRTYSGQNNPAYSAYSNAAAATTSAYPARYVSPSGKDTNDGKAPDPGHAWRSLAHATKSLACGEVLLVAGGAYAADAVVMEQKCTAAAKAVVLVNPDESATITSPAPNAAHAVLIPGQHVVIDGLRLNSTGTATGEYDVEIGGSYNALLNVESRPPVIPSFKFGVAVYGNHNLIYRCYLHDYGSPDETQNPSGNGGFLLALLWPGSTENVIWSNHLTRGGHDESLCKGGCSNNRWLNNVMDGGWGQGWVGVFSGWAADRNLIEGNVIKSVGQLVPYFKPAIQLSGADNTVRRNVVMQSRTWALEVSSFNGGTASGNLVHNNVFYDSGGCYFQSSSRGSRAYYNVAYVNNICFRIGDLATQIYLGNTTNRIAVNDILALDAAGKPQAERPLIVWNRLGGGAFETPKSVAAADRTYDPPFSRNRALSVLPQFADEANADFHLTTGGPLLEAGLPVANAAWGSSAGPVDLGAFGLTIAVASPWPADPAMERARAGDYEAALKGLRAKANLPNALPLEAALLRAADDDAAAAAVAARMGSPAATELMARFERAQQGAADPGIWDTLAASPDRALAMADEYLQWGLTRDALELLGHKGPKGAPAPDDALFYYYRSYCRDRLDYAYYAAEDLRVAATRALKDVPARLAAALPVLQSAIQRNPVDAYAHYLMGVLHRDQGRAAAAREEMETALKLRPGFPDAQSVLAKLPPAPATVRKLRPFAPAGATSALGKAPAAPAPAPKTPAGIAALALRIAASGDINGAASYFTAANFPNQKQETAVREAFVELRLQRLLAMAVAKQCSGVEQGIEGLEAEDKRLPFTFGGFGAVTKGPRFQYLLGVVEFACVDEKAARRRWEKVSKADAGITTPDYAYPVLALAKLEPDVGRARARKALGFLAAQLTSAADTYRGVLLYSQGLLQAAVGQPGDATSSFRAGAEAGPPGMVEYLNLAAIRELDR